MKQEIDPKDTNRKEAFEHWMNSPMPMVTLMKTFDVTRLYKLSKKRGMKFNMLVCWCIAKTASKMEEFYLLPEHGKLYKYDRLAINMIVNNKKGGLSFCDIASTDDLEEFNANYLHLTKTISETCQDILDSEAVIVGTSAILEIPILSWLGADTGRNGSVIIFPSPSNSIMFRWMEHKRGDFWQICNI